jgi:hypothetical protein
MFDTIKTSGIYKVLAMSDLGKIIIEVPVNFFHWTCRNKNELERDGFKIVEEGNWDRTLLITQQSYYSLLCSECYED